MEQLHRYFQTLGLAPDASWPQVRRAYRDLVRVWHPDRFGNDPRLQQKAQEKLKEINEAYRVLKVVLTELPYRRIPPASPPAGPTAPPSTASGPATAASASSPPHPFRLPSIAAFLSLWPNVLLLIFLVAAARIGYLRHGMSAVAAGYLLQMALFPLLLALACNSRLGGKRSLWAAYLATLALAALLLVMDGLSLKKELREASPSRYSLPEEIPYGGGGGTGAGSPFTAPLEPAQRKPPGGPVAPREPAAPVVPSPAPPVAPVVPRGR